jgi:hypothetical protein
MGDK